LTDLPNKTELEKPENLIPYSNNPKEHPEAQIDKIASSIKNYGFVQPVVVDSENEVIIGHGRLKAAKKLGLDEIPVIRHDDISDSEAKALRLADNKIAESEWEDEKLAVELEQLTESDDYEELIHGFNEDEMSEYLDKLNEESDVEVEESKKEMPDDLKNWKILNLYAGIGGNRRHGLMNVK
jgi:ParB/RepB/Spo0J family partition protein